MAEMVWFCACALHSVRVT